MYGNLMADTPGFCCLSKSNTERSLNGFLLSRSRMSG
jgi:hypothetical protein